MRRAAASRRSRPRSDAPTLKFAGHGNRADCRDRRSLGFARRGDHAHTGSGPGDWSSAAIVNPGGVFASTTWPSISFAFRPATRDLEAIGDHITRDNRRAADRVVNRIWDSTNFPLLGHGGRVAGTHELLIRRRGLLSFILSAMIRSKSSPPFTPRRRPDSI
jgi:hypothetical protein